MKPLVVHPQAKAELDGAIAYYESRVTGLGVDFLDNIERAFQKIQQNPQAWPLYVDPRFRRYVLDRFPYSVFYIERLDAIWIVAVAHAKRRPDYWKRRDRTL